MALVAAARVAVADPAPGGAASFLRFFSWRAPVPADVGRAVSAYERGRFYDAARAAGRVLAAAGAGPFADDARLVRGLAFLELGWCAEAGGELRSVLDREDVSPYYPLALLGLVESRRCAGSSVAGVWRRYYRQVQEAGGARAADVRSALEAYGEPAEPRSSPVHEASFSSELLAKLRARKERPRERFLYLVAVDSFRERRFADSQAALSQIPLLSLYHPYAVYLGAQNRWALGDEAAARAALERLAFLPPTTVEEQALVERARVLLAELSAAGGDGDRAIGLARSLEASPQVARRAEVVRAAIHLERGEPALALAVAHPVLAVEADRAAAARAAVLRARASLRLDDPAGAADVLAREARAIEEERRALEAGRDALVERLRAAVERRLAGEVAARAAERARVAAGIRRVASFKGPPSLGKLVRVLATSHRNTVLGGGVFDTHLLAGRDPRGAAAGPREDPLWLEYLASPLRPAIERAAGAERRLRARHPDRRAVLDALLQWLGGAFPGAAGRAPGDLAAASAEAARLLGTPLDAGSPRALAAARRRTADRIGPGGGTDEAAGRALALRLAEDSFRRGLGELLEARGSRLRSIAWELEAERTRALDAEGARLRSVLRSAERAADARR